MTEIYQYLDVRSLNLEMTPLEYRCIAVDDLLELCSGVSSMSDCNNESVLANFNHTDSRYLYTIILGDSLIQAQIFKDGCTCQMY